MEDKDLFRFWAGVLMLVVGGGLFTVGFFTFFVTWIYAIPLIVIAILLLADFGREEKIEKIKKRGR
jgi:membrane protein implicated in regulation of membrane protease activity